jgi:hypothetical protein
MVEHSNIKVGAYPTGLNRFFNRHPHYWCKVGHPFSYIQGKANIETLSTALRFKASHTII